ncbi:DUF3953 domain-containing protein [Lentibacillus sediminis]|uniref:DUF3953 domain-containing protein n=1 Tax=Lentibacillus sediminis TaxID=1940529 RepID=UPI000C1B8170|nr:DUF3953 domain-containing protein [Lentibacillus sediminis]
MLDKIRNILSILIIIFSGYLIITQDFYWMPHMMVGVGGLLLVTGLLELQKEKKFWGFASILISLFVFYVSVQGFLGGW